MEGKLEASSTLNSFMVQKGQKSRSLRPSCGINICHVSHRLSLCRSISCERALLTLTSLLFAAFPPFGIPFPADSSGMSPFLSGSDISPNVRHDSKEGKQTKKQTNYFSFKLPRRVSQTRSVCAAAGQTVPASPLLV